MQVITDLDTFLKPKISIVTQGTFDGLHVGHRQILGKIVELAKQQKGKSILVTFHPHPRHVIYKSENNIKLLTTFGEKVKLLTEIGLDYLVVLPFDETLSKMHAMNFVRDILVEKIGVNTMIVGYDHRFGRNREGSLDDLKEYAEIYGFEVNEIPAHDVDEAIVSSTKIRNSLLCGDVESAAKFLGRAYSLTGRVVHGRKLGKTIGYPTANLFLEDSDKLIPGNGIYAVNVSYNEKEYGGMLSIGNNPTIAKAVWSIEVNIFDFDKDIYGKEITIYFKKHLREEVKFGSIEDLIIQLKADEIEVRDILRNYGVN